MSAATRVRPSATATGRAAARRFGARCGNDPAPLWVDNYLSDPNRMDPAEFVKFLQLVLSILPMASGIRVLSRNWVDGHRVSGTDILTALR